MNEHYKEITKKTYDENSSYFAESFKKRNDPNKRYALNRFVQLLPNKSRILDAGCGSGDAAQYFTKQGLNVDCIDFSEKMIELCKQKELNAKVMDMEQITFEAETFNGVWASASLLHLPKNNMQAVVDKFYEILKKEGICYICVKEGYGEIYVEEKNMTRFFSYWTEDEIKERFKLFQVIEHYKTQASSEKLTWLEFLLKK